MEEPMEVTELGFQILALGDCLEVGLHEIK